MFHPPGSRPENTIPGDHLSSLSYQWKVGFEYLDEGIVVNEQWYPVLKMEWAQGTTMTSWIDSHVYDPIALTGLAARFADLVGDLATAGIGHGDLQHGNLLVAKDGSIRLVDYDGVYVPALDGLPAVERVFWACCTGAAAPHLDLPTLADGGYGGAGIGVHMPVKHPTDGQVLDVDNRAYNALLRGLRCMGERGFAVLTGRWRGLRHITVSPSRLGRIVKAALVLTHFEYDQTA